MSQEWPATGLGELSEAVHAWDLLKEVAIIFITFNIGWSQTWREHSPAQQQKFALKIS